MVKRKLRAVVTGATRGIGYAVAQKLLDNDIEVIGTGTTLESNIPDGAEFCQADFLDKKLLQNFILLIKSKKIDILVNNAGINKIDKFESVKEEDFDKIIRVNLKAPFLLSQAVIPHMKEKKWGRIVNIASIWSQKSKEHRASYSASKFGLDGITAALSVELAEYGILANSVSPGFVDTDLTRKILGDVGIKEIQKRIPIKRLGKVEEIAELVCWLASDSNSYLSGQNIVIDGGFVRA
tara:strand:+ start:1458 stop:2171 length:714 start_codon:yes stop_codon:yes gene_type:complete